MPRTTKNTKGKGNSPKKNSRAAGADMERTGSGGFELGGLAYIGVGILLGVFLYGRYEAALPAFIQMVAGGLFGWCALLCPVILVGEGVYLIRKKDYGRLYFKMFLAFLALFNLSILSSLFTSPDGSLNAFDAFLSDHVYHGGGFFGALVASPCTRMLTVVPCAVVFIITLLFLITLIFKLSIVRLIAGFTRSVKKEVVEIDEARSYEMGRRARERLDDGMVQRRKRQIDFDIDGGTPPDDIKSGRKAKDEKNKQSDADIDVFLFDAPLKKKNPAKDEKIKGETALDAIIDSGIDENLDEDEIDDGFYMDNLTVMPEDPKKEKLSPAQQAALSSKLDQSAKSRPLRYRYPAPTLLTQVKNKKGNDSRDELRDTAHKLVDTLKSFGVEVKLLHVSRGPTVTRYELQPNVGVKVSKITSLADDIALNLAAPSVRIEAPIPGKAAIGIEIPNSEVTSVALRDVLESDEFKNAKSKLAVGLGKDIAGKSVIANIAKMPHVLIAGATGSGKSVCINSLIISILYKADPNEVKFVMIDPKRVELLPYNGIPHLLTPVVVDPKKAAGALNWAVAEMVRRYDMFAENGVRDLEGYNASAELEGRDKLPQIVIIIDELADLMMVTPKEVEDSICRLAQLARACGMHLVIATQRPSVNVITGIIKANIPSRIAFAVSSQVDSRTILDGAGAEKLLGRGDMLYMPMGASKAVRLQGSFISDADVERVVEFIKDTSEPGYDEDIADKINGTGEVADIGDADELLPRAIEIAIELERISTSMLQRKLGIGFARAGRIVDQMEARGIISGADGSKPRNVLISAQDILDLN